MNARVFTAILISSWVVLVTRYVCSVILCMHAEFVGGPAYVSKHVNRCDVEQHLFSLQYAI